MEIMFLGDANMKLGLALSGGGMRGIAHIGVLKALEDNNIKIDVIGGASSGGMVASLYALGYSPYYIYILFKRYAKDIISISNGPIVNGIGNYMINKKLEIKGLKQGKELEDVFEEMARRKGIKKIQEIKKPLVVTTVDIQEIKKYVFTNDLANLNEEYYIDKISVGKAVRATCSFPAIFCPCEYETHMFMDGGVLDNVPVEELKKQGADRVIAVNFEADKIHENSNVMDITMKTIDIMGLKSAKQQLEKSDYVLTVSTDGTGLLDIDKADVCYKNGYNAVMKNIDEIKKVVKDSTVMKFPSGSKEDYC